MKRDMNREEEKESFYVYTPVDGDSTGTMNGFSLEEAIEIAKRSHQNLLDCKAEDTTAHVINRVTGEFVFSAHDKI